jgi:hypothetical protein
MGVLVTWRQGNLPTAAVSIKSCEAVQCGLVQIALALAMQCWHAQVEGCVESGVCCLACTFEHNQRCCS